jgi:hypothetical protein
MLGDIALADIFISYSSSDRDVAMRVRDALQQAGYEIFWDQSTPPGKDWDSWIRDQLGSAKLVIALWSGSSVASPNVRHEAIIAREAGKLLPVMVDELKPTDFPMGLFMVQALSIGRSAREFNAVRAKFLTEVEARIGAGDEERAAALPPSPPSKGRRKLLIGMAAGLLLLVAAAWVFWPQLSFWLNPDAPPATAEQVQASVAGEQLARGRVAREAETTLAGEAAMIGSTWAWGVGQLIAGAPAESRELGPRYFAYLAGVVNAECRCYYSDSIPHTIANAWVVMAAARLRRPIPAGLLETILAGQHPEGWWMISFNAVRAPENGAIHPTALLTIALAEARRAGIVPADQRPRVDAALRRAVGWLNRGPENGANWTDYPNNQRRTENLVFAAYAAVASHVATDGQPGNAAAAFLRSASTLPPPTDKFPSGAYIPMTNGARFFDDYRHPTSPWIGAAAMLTWRQADGSQRRVLREIVRQWLEINLNDEKLLREDWITAETLFLRALAFPAATQR